MATPKMFDLHGRVAVVTGGNGGIGRRADNGTDYSDPGETPERANGQGEGGSHGLASGTLRPVPISRYAGIA